MEQHEILHIFEKTQGLLEGHFLLSSGLHSPQYFQCARILQYPDIAEKLAADIATQFKSADIDLVISPAIGGLIIGHEVARALKCRFVFTERAKDTDETVLRRGFEIASNERALIVEDVLTTGRSVREVLHLLQSEKTEAAGAGFVIDRSSAPATIGLHKYAVLEMPAVIYEPNACPLCDKGIPLVKPGSRKEPKAELG